MAALPLTMVALSSLVLPPWTVAPPTFRDPEVACAISLHELTALAALRSHASDECKRVEHHPAVTVDVGLNRPERIEIDANGIELTIARGDEHPVTTTLPWSFVSKAVKKGRAGVWECWCDEEEPCLPSRVEGFSELTQRTASLLPLPGLEPPTAVLGGFSMHRMKEVTPREDTDRKLRALGSRLRGVVLDVVTASLATRGVPNPLSSVACSCAACPSRLSPSQCTGLGYTAIGAASKPAVERVLTIELDPLMIEMQRANPHSANLFEDGTSDGSSKITRLQGDATEVLPALPAAAFDACIHDPPANAMSGELYSAVFYAQIHRCLKPGGAFYHYIGDPDSKASGRLFKGVAERLQAAGFDGIKKCKLAYGISATARSNSRSS